MRTVYSLFLPLPLIKGCVNRTSLESATGNSGVVLW